MVYKRKLRQDGWAEFTDYEAIVFKEFGEKTLFALAETAALYSFWQARLGDLSIHSRGFYELNERNRETVIKGFISSTTIYPNKRDIRVGIPTDDSTIKDIFEELTKPVVRHV